MDSTPNVSLNVVGTTSDSKDTDSVNNENTPLIPTREAAMPISPLDGAVPSGRDDGQISGTFEAITSAEEARTPLLEVESSARGTGGGETGGRNGSMGSGIDGVEAGGALGSGGHGDGMNGRGIESDDNFLDQADIAYGANSFMAVVKPVTLTMALSAAITVSLYSDADGATNSALAVYEVYDESTTALDPSSVRFGKSLINAFIIVLFLAAATVVIVWLYWMRCMRCLLGYMAMSSAVLLGLMGGAVWSSALEVFQFPCDVFSYYGVLWNFAVVGIVAIFYQKGVPTVVTQGYLVATSIIMAWQLSRFEEWTGWSLLVVLALYDLCAVLTPCGPLKALVHLMQEYEEPMPGLLYEAELPAGPPRRRGRAGRSNQPGGRRERPDRRRRHHEGERNPTEDERRTPEDDSAFAGRGGGGGTSSSRGRGFSRRRGGSDVQGREGQDEAEMATRGGDDSGGGGGYGGGSGREGSAVRAADVGAGEKSDSSGTIEQDFSSTASSMPSSAVQQSTEGDQPDRTQSLVELAEEPDVAVSSSLSPPSYEIDTRQAQDSDQRNSAADRRTARIGVRFRDGRDQAVGEGLGEREEALFGTGEDARVLIPENNGRRVTADVARVDLSTAQDEELEGVSIKLGLGDFVFYSVLVSKAALYGFTAWAVCVVVIVFGLGATLVLLAVYRMALPALPISIGLGTLFYLLTRFSIQPYVEEMNDFPLYF